MRSEKYDSLCFSPPPGKFFMQDEEIASLRASYAYKYDHSKWHEGTGFPWDVAMRELGAIKARVTGGHKTVTGDFMTISI
jgi:RNA-dependent RNA polymerase